MILNHSYIEGFDSFKTNRLTFKTPEGAPEKTDAPKGSKDTETETGEQQREGQTALSRELEALGRFTPKEGPEGNKSQEEIRREIDEGEATKVARTAPEHVDPREAGAQSTEMRRIIEGKPESKESLVARINAGADKVLGDKEALATFLAKTKRQKWEANNALLAETFGLDPDPKFVKAVVEEIQFRHGLTGEDVDGKWGKGTNGVVALHSKLERDLSQIAVNFNGPKAEEA